jgi:Zn-finger in ubiquitin-hydrolases and other protein
MTEVHGIDPAVPPSGTGCLDCDASGGWWLHLRRCAQCGHIGCCDTSPAQHASAHAAATGHPLIRSFEPGEDWFWSFQAEAYDGPELAPPRAPPAQPASARASRPRSPELAAPPALNAA